MQHARTAVRSTPSRGLVVSSFVAAVLLLTCAHVPAWAQAYRCKQPNGSMSFQDHPCAGDAPGAAVSLQPLNNGATESYGTAQKANRGPDVLQKKQASMEQRAYDEKVKANNEQTMAYNRKAMCNAAREQLGVLKTPTRVFKRDNNGEKQYVSDDNRQAEIAAAQKRVNEACN